MAWIEPGKVSAGAEASLTFLMFTGSLGAVRLGPEAQYYYTEANFWCYGNVAMGYGLLGRNGMSMGAWHYFVGIPVPIPFLNYVGGKGGNHTITYIEPFWRSVFETKSSDHVGREIGILLKISVPSE